MNTLREIGEFVGIPQGSLEVARFGGPPTTGLSIISSLVTEGRKGERLLSMQAIIQALQNLTPITLEAQIVGSQSGEEPFEPVIRLNASGGITWFTEIDHDLDGKTRGVSGDLGSAGGDFKPTQLGPGNWQLVVRRAGISNAGFVSLSKKLGTITVLARPQPRPKDPPRPPLVPPSISVKSNGDGSFMVSGSKFLPNAAVTIRVVDSVQPLSPNLFFAVSATSEGEIKDFPTGKICQVAGGRITFSAQDGRIDAGQAVTSNFVQQTCPF